jgi:hypothetical protein
MNRKSEKHFLSTARQKILPDGKELRGKTQARKPACDWLYICWGPHFAEGRKTGTLVFSRAGTRVWLYGLIFIGCGSICAGRLNRRFSREDGGFFIGMPSR